jgi:hypothetical protein
MRDRLVHHYFDINLDVLWTTVTEDAYRRCSPSFRPRWRTDLLLEQSPHAGATAPCSSRLRPVELRAGGRRHG